MAYDSRSVTRNRWEASLDKQISIGRLHVAERQFIRY